MANVTSLHHSPYDTRGKKRSHQDVSRAPGDSLHVVGYTIFKAAIEIPEGILQETIRRSEHAGAIFNHNEKMAKNDHKRRQCTLSMRKCNTVMRTFLRGLNQFVRNHISSDLQPAPWVALHSRPGCQDQAAHCDYELGEELVSASDNEMPLSVIVALMPGTRLNVWPNSLGLVSLSDSEIKKVAPIACKVVEMEVGDVLVFRGDFVHAGSGYDTDNYRLHTFLDSAVVPRTLNRTWIIHKHGSEALRNVILPKE